MTSRYKDQLNDPQVNQPSRPVEEHKKVSVLLLSWETSDLDGIDKEIDDLEDLFTKTFQFSVKRFRIPEQQSFIQLETRIIQFIASNDSPSSLLIIYYGGNADRNDDKILNKRDIILNKHRKSIWTAYRDGGPRLPWYKIQPRFNEIKADVLLLLDCNYGTPQAARGRQGSNRVELLTACAMDGKTPPPGPHSFTTALIRAIRQEVAVEDSTTISRIHIRLSTGAAHYSATPVYLETAAGASKRAIRLVSMRKGNLVPTDHGSDTSVPSRDFAYHIDYAGSKRTEIVDPESSAWQGYEDSLARQMGEMSFLRHDDEGTSVGQAVEDSSVNQKDEDFLARQEAGNSFARQEDEVSEVMSLKSLFSVPSLTSGETHSSVDSRQEMATEKFAVFPLHDKILELLYREAFEKVAIERIERDLTRLLLTFAVDLTQEAETINQKSAARFVRRDIATIVSKQYDPDRDENSEQMRELMLKMLKSPERHEMLESYLQQQCDRRDPPDVLPNLGSTSKEEPEDDSGSDISDVEMRNFNDVKTFVLGSSAFSNLRENLRRFLTGDSGRPQPASTLGEYDHGKDESNDDDSESDDLLEVLESETEIPYIESMNLSSKMLRTIADMGRNVAEYSEIREPVVEPGHNRIRWTCVCGARLFDDFQEITPGSLAQLETFLNDTGIREVPNRTPNSHERGFPAPVAESLSNQSVQTFQTARSDSNLSPHGNEPLAEGLRHRGRGASTARQKTVPASSKFWILPLFQYQRYGTKVKHLHVDARMSDEALFETAKAKYFEETSRIRRFFALRGVKKISYVKFIHASREPDIHKYDDWPPEKYSKPKGEWIYKGCPAKKKHIPLVGHNYLMHLWQNPSHSDLATYRSRRSTIRRVLDYLRSNRAMPSPESPRQRSPHQDADRTLSDSSTARGDQAHPDNPQQLHTDLELASIDRSGVATNSASSSVEASQDQGPRSSYVFLRTPRKEGDQLMSDDESPPEAWGLYFEEGFRMHHCLILILFIYILASLAFGIYWCIKYGLVGPKSGAAAFGISSWMIALISLVTAVWFKWAD